MATIHDVPPKELIEAVAEKFKDRSEIEQPEWMEFAKTGEDREFPPEQDDFWERRAASVLRKVALDGPIGVSRLSNKYGGAKDGSNRYRVAPAHNTDGSKKIAREILVQLEDAGFVDRAEGEGRRISAEGQSFLDDTAGEVLEDLDRPDLERYVQ